MLSLQKCIHKRGGLGDFKKRASCWNKRLRGTSCRQVTVLVSYLHVNLTASMSSAPSTIAPQRRAGLRAIRSSTWRRDCRTRRSITASRRLAVPFIRPGRNSTRTSVQQKKGVVGKTGLTGEQTVVLSWIGRGRCWCPGHSNTVTPTFLSHVDFFTSAKMTARERQPSAGDGV